MNLFDGIFELFLLRVFALCFAHCLFSSFIVGILNGFDDCGYSKPFDLCSNTISTSFLREFNFGSFGPLRILRLSPLTLSVLVTLRMSHCVGHRIKTKGK